MNQITKNIINGIIYILLVLITFYLGIKVILFLFPFVLAYIFFVLTRPIYNFLVNKLKLKSKISNIISISLFYIMIFGIFIYLIYLITFQIYSATLNIPTLITNIREVYDSIMIKNEIQFPKYILMLINKLFSSSIEYSTKLGVMAFNFSKETLSRFPTYIVNLIIIILATFLMADNKSTVIELANKQLPAVWIEKMVLIKTKVIDMFFGYIKAQIIIISACFLEVLLSLYLIDTFVYKFNYVVLGSILIAFIDALPILGAGAVLLPAVIISFVLGNTYLGIALLLTYIFVTISRQVLEPKLISNNMGSNPLLTLISMYVGFKLFGILGFLLGPMLTIVITILFSREIEYGFFKFLVDDKEKNE